MSFRCGICGKPQEARTRPVKTVTKWKPDGKNIAEERYLCRSCAAEWQRQKALRDSKVAPSKPRFAKTLLEL